MIGTVKFFRETEGYGFLRPDDRGADVFVHVSNINNGAVLAQGQRVEFEIGPSRRDNRNEAKNVRVIE
jgi:CspA family cold shock protein